MRVISAAVILALAALAGCSNMDAWHQTARHGNIQGIGIDPIRQAGSAASRPAGVPIDLPGRP